MTCDSRQNAIRELAYEKWESAGCPPGDGIDFWLNAENELNAASVADATAANGPIQETKKSSIPAPPLKIARVASQARKKAG